MTCPADNGKPHIRRCAGKWCAYRHPRARRPFMICAMFRVMVKRLKDRYDMEQHKKNAGRAKPFLPLFRYQHGGTR